MDLDRLKTLARLIRYYILVSTTEAGSGHPTSSLSAADLMTVLLFGSPFRFDADNPANPNNDRIIFSKGHASPLFYSLWAAAGKLNEEELRGLRRFGGPLEGHPTPAFPYTEAATGSLGQGLSIGVGMALNGKFLDKLPYRTCVLLGDSEMAEGAQWEAIQIAAHYKLDNLVGILDANRLGQRGETMYGHDLTAYARRIEAFGWEPYIIDGHSLSEIQKTYGQAWEVSGKPVMIIARTYKGKGVSFLEDQPGWHGKPLSRDQFNQALEELGPVNPSTTGGNLEKPETITPAHTSPSPAKQFSHSGGEMVATRKAYGLALARLAPQYPPMVVLDAEVSNSTHSDIFKKAVPDRFFEMYVAEQNMVGAALGLAKRGKKPFVSSFAAFLTRAFDQIRMSRYSEGNIVFCGSHAGVSIGEDGSSQMGLEDLAMFRSIQDCVVLYPSDGVSTEKLVEQAAEQEGMVYIRTTRMATPVLYNEDEPFPVGGSKILRSSEKDSVAVVAAGITVHEALAAADDLKEEGISVRVIDLYSIQPLDLVVLETAATQCKAVITVEDHVPAGGIGEAVAAALSQTLIPVYSLAVRKVPRSGKPAELLDFERISRKAITTLVREVQ